MQDGDMRLKAGIKVRRAGMEDLEAITGLCGQLGYKLPKEEVGRGLEDVLGNREHAVFVADTGDGAASGWVHAYLRHLFIAEKTVEIGGLVVDEKHRRAGIGKLLMESAEAWAREQGCSGVVLRSNEIRKEAHEFYKAIGYKNVKKHLTFLKSFKGAEL